MTNRLEAVTFREGRDGRKYGTKIGVAFQTRDGSGWNVRLDALPVNGEFSLFPPREREDATRGKQEQPPLKDDLDDEIPF